MVAIVVDVVDSVEGLQQFNPVCMYAAATRVSAPHAHALTHKPDINTHNYATR